MSNFWLFLLYLLQYWLKSKIYYILVTMRRTVASFAYNTSFRCPANNRRMPLAFRQGDEPGAPFFNRLHPRPASNRSATETSPYRSSNTWSPHARLRRLLGAPSVSESGQFPPSAPWCRGSDSHTVSYPRRSRSPVVANPHRCDQRSEQYKKPVIRND